MNEDDTDNTNEDANEEDAVAIPHQMDVLCGTTRDLDDHPGNLLYTVLIDQHAQEYAEVTSSEKKRIITNIINEIQVRGRFRQFRQDRGLWFELSEPRKRNRVGHSLRLRRKRIVIQNQAVLGNEE